MSTQYPRSGRWHWQGMVKMVIGTTALSSAPLPCGMQAVASSAFPADVQTNSTLTAEQRAKGEHPVQHGTQPTHTHPAESSHPPRRVRPARSVARRSPCGTQPATTRGLPAALPAAMTLLMAVCEGFFTVQVLMSHRSASSRCASSTSLHAWIQVWGGAEGRREVGTRSVQLLMCFM